MTDGNSGSPPALLLIVCGLPFAGKTTMSNQLASKLRDAVHVEIDQINSDRGLGLDGQSVPLAEWPKTYEIAYERAAAALQSGQTVIFDATNYSRAQREVLRLKARRASAESAVVFVDVSEPECRSRWLSNRESGERFDVLESDFERVVSRFDAPQADERVLLFLPGMQVDDLVSGLTQAFGL
jgi:tRNA uridine 5-carbamoylmethylation protein Kti12